MRHYGARLAALLELCGYSFAESFGTGSQALAAPALPVGAAARGGF